MLILSNKTFFQVQKNSIACDWNYFFIKDLMCLFLERGKGREKEKERNINVWLPLERSLLGGLTRPATQACALTGNQTCNPLVCRPAFNPLSYTSQERNYFK